MPDKQSDRREFLAGLGLLPLLGTTALAVGGDETKLIADPTRPMQPSAADLGTWAKKVSGTENRQDWVIRFLTPCDSFQRRYEPSGKLTPAA